MYLNMNALNIIASDALYRLIKCISRFDGKKSVIAITCIALQAIAYFIAKFYVPATIKLNSDNTLLIRHHLLGELKIKKNEIDDTDRQLLLRSGLIPLVLAAFTNLSWARSCLKVNIVVASLFSIIAYGLSQLKRSWINIKDKDGDSILIHLASSRIPEALDLLTLILKIKEKEIDFNIQNDNGNTMLMYLVLNQSPKALDTLKLILEIKEIDINIKNNSGDTALSWACDNKQALQLLSYKKPQTGKD